MKSFEIKENDGGQRLDRYLQKILGNAGRDRIYKLLRKKVFKLNGKRVTSGEHFLAPGDVVGIFLADETFAALATPPRPDADAGRKMLPFPIVYEDDRLLVVDKPRGMLTHPTQDEYRETAATYVLGYLGSCVTPTFRPAPISRLDQNTSGLLVFAKDYETLKDWNSAMREHRIDKFYLAVVEGRMRAERGSISGALTRDERANRSSVRITSRLADRDSPASGSAAAASGSGDPRESEREIRTDFRVVERVGGYTLIEARLITGRSHQIRASFAAIGHPLAGDLKYGGHVRDGLRSQLLHCCRIVRGDYRFESDSPEIDTFIGRLR